MLVKSHGAFQIKQLHSISKIDFKNSKLVDLLGSLGEVRSRKPYQEA